MSEEYQPGGCRVVFGLIAIVLGGILIFAAFPVGILPGLALVGGGMRLMTGSGVF